MTNSNVFEINLNKDFNEGPLHQFIKKMIFWMIREKKNSDIELSEGLGPHLWRDEMSLLDIFHDRIITDVKLEYKIQKNLIPDIFVKFQSGEKILIEIVVQGPPTIKKIKKLSDLDYGFYQLYIPSMSSFYYKTPKDFWRHEAHKIKVHGYSPESDQMEKLSLNLRLTRDKLFWNLRYKIKSKKFILTYPGRSIGDTKEPFKETHQQTWVQGKLKGVNYAEDLRLYEQIFTLACRKGLVALVGRESLLLNYRSRSGNSKILKVENFIKPSTPYQSKFEDTRIRYEKGGVV